MHNKLVISSEEKRQAAIISATATIAQAELEASKAADAYEKERQAIMDLIKSKIILAGTGESELSSLDTDYAKRMAESKANTDSLKASLAELVAMGPVQANTSGFDNVSSAARSVTKTIDEEAEKQIAKVSAMKDQVTQIGEALSESLKVQANDVYDTTIQNMDDQIKHFKDTKSDEASTFRNFEDEKKYIQADYYDRETGLIEQRTELITAAQYAEAGIIEEKVSLLSAAHYEQMTFIDAENVAALGAIDGKIQKELEYIRLNNEELYNKLMALDAEAQGIKDAAATRKRLKDEEAEADRKAELQKRLDAAETAEERIKAQKAYDDYMATLAEKAQAAQDKQKLESIAADKNTLIKENTAENSGYMDNIKNLQSEQQTILDTAIEAYSTKVTDEAQKLLDKTVANAPKMAVEILKNTEIGLQAAQALIDKFNPNWEAGNMSFMDIFAESMNGETGDDTKLVEGMTQAGQAALQTVIDNIKAQAVNPVELLNLTLDEQALKDSGISMAQLLGMDTDEAAKLQAAQATPATTADGSSTGMVPLSTDGEPLPIDEKTFEQINAMLMSVGEQWQDSGLDFLQFFITGLEEGLDELKQYMEETAVYAMQGLIDGMKSKEQEIVAQAEHIAYLIRNALKTDLEIESPSKVTKELGSYVGEGLIIGTVDKIKAMIPKIQQAASSIPAAMAAAGGHIGARAPQVISSNRSSVNNYYNSELPIIMEHVDMRGEQNIRTVSEQLAFITRQSLAAKGGQ